MSPWRNRSAIRIALLALPIEAVATSLLLAYAPVRGIPRNYSLWLQLCGDLSALFHAPPLLLNGFLSRRIRVPAYILYTDTFAFGYLLVVAILALFWRVFRSLRGGSVLGSG